MYDTIVCIYCLLPRHCCSDHTNNGNYVAIIIIIIRQPLCPVVGQMSQHAVFKLSCRVLSSAI